MKTDRPLLAEYVLRNAALFPLFYHLKHLLPYFRIIAHDFLFLSCKTIGDYIYEQEVVGRWDTIKVQNMHKCSLRNFHPGLLPNSEQKVDKMHVSPAIANALVGGSFQFGLYNVIIFYKLNLLNKA